MTTATETRIGFDLSCPRCGADNTCTLDLADLDTVRCHDCEAEVSIANDIRPMLEGWAKLLKWIDLCPTE